MTSITCVFNYLKGAINIENCFRNCVSEKRSFSILDPISHMCSHFFNALSVTHKSNNCSLKLASR